MGSDITGGRDQRAFLVPWPLTESSLWTAQAAYTQQTPLAGTPEAAGSYGLGIQTAGVQTSTVNVRTTRAGSAEVGGFVWKYSTDSLYLGKDEENLLTGYESAQGTGLAAGYEYIVLDALGTSDGLVYTLARYYDSSTYRYTVYIRDKTGAYTSVNLHTLSGSDHRVGGLCQAEDGSILAACVVVNGSRAQVAFSRSTDQGATWIHISLRALPESIDLGGSPGAGASGFDIYKLRMRSAQGQVCMMLGLYAHNTSTSTATRLFQYASTDGGCTFTLISEGSTSVPFWMPELVVTDNQFTMVYIKSVDEVHSVRIPTAFTAFPDATLFGAYYNTTVNNAETVAGTVSNNHWTVGQLSAWEDPAGKIYAVMEEVGANGKLFMVSTSDAGLTWYYQGGGGAGAGRTANKARIWWLNDTTTKMVNISGAKLGAGSILFCNGSSSPTTLNSDALTALYYGGYTSVTAPETEEYGLYWQRIRWDYTWIPIEDPDNISIFSATGAGASTIEVGDLEVVTGSNTKYWDTTSGAMSGNILATGMIFRASVRVVSGGSIASDAIGINARISDTSANYYDIDLNFASTGVRVVSGATTIGETTISTTGASGVEVMVAIANNKISAWVRLRNHHKKTWTTIVNGGTIPAGSGAVAPFLRFGHIASSSAESEWFEFSFVSSTNTGTQMATGFSNYADLYAQTYPARGNYVYVDDGLYLTTYDGPARENDQYTIPVRYQYGLENIFHAVSPTPQITWRGVSVVSGDNAEIFLPFLLETAVGSVDDTRLGADVVGLHLSNINFLDFRIERRDVGTSSWVVMQTVQNKIGPFTFRRDGASVTVSAGTSGPYMTLHEMAGWRIKLDGGGESVVFRKIRTNSEGSLTTKTTKTCVIMLEDVDSTDPTTGTATVIPDSVCCVIDTQGAIGSAWGLRINTQTTREKYFQIGSFSFGRVAVLGKQYSRGREITFTPAVETFDQSDGIRRTRDTGTGFREFSISWSEGVDTSEFWSANPDPNYIKLTAGGTPCAAQWDVPFFMQGLNALTNGAETPMVYLPQIYLGGSTWVFNRKHDHIYCALDDEVTITNVLGDEFAGSPTGEVFRVSKLTFREVV